MALRKDTVYDLPVRRVEYFNGRKHYIVEYEGDEYRVRMYAHQTSKREELSCVYTGSSSNGTPIFEQSFSDVLGEIYEPGCAYQFKIAQECIDQNTGAFYYKLSDSYGFYHRVYMTQNPMYKMGDSVMAKVLDINDNYMSLDLLPKESANASFALGDMMDLKKAIEPSLLDFSKLDPYRDTTLRDYQVDNKKKIYEAWQQYRSVMLQMPTGTGKTRLFVSIARDIFDYGASIKKAFKVLILAHRKELIEQISDHLGNKYRLAHGLIISQNIEQKKYSMQVGSVPTLNRRLERWEDKNFDVIIIDEAHHVKAKSYKKIIDMFPKAKILGVTATPYRLNHAGFRPEFDELIVSPSVAEFIKRGYLCEYDYYSIPPTSELQKEIDRMKLDFEGDYKESEMMDVMDRDFVRANILDTYQRFANGKKAIVYTISRDHNVHLAEKFSEAGIISAAIDSETPKEKRDEIVGKFRRGEIQVLFNVNIFSEGFDCPDVEVIQLARPTKSLSMYLQQVGRGLRPSAGKERLLILDNVGLYNKFGFPSARRKWRYHFEGQDVDESPAAHKSERDEEREVKDIFEGDEAVTMLHTSTEEVVSTESLDSITRDYKEQFIRYASQTIDPKTVQGYARNIESTLDAYIRRNIKSDFISLFSTVDLNDLDEIRRGLSLDTEFVHFNDEKHHVFSAALNKYIAFAKWYDEHKSDAPSLPDISAENETQDELVDYREQFRAYLLRKEFSSSAAEQFITELKYGVDSHIKQVINRKHKTVFMIADVKVLKGFRDVLMDNLTFIRYNKIKDFKPEAALLKYIEFANSLSLQKVSETQPENVKFTDYYKFKKPFEQYLASIGIKNASIRNYTSALQNDVDPLVRKILGGSFKSVFYYDELDIIKPLYELFVDEEEYKELCARRYNIPDLAFRKYVDFIQQHEQEVKDNPTPETTVPEPSLSEEPETSRDELSTISEIDSTLQELESLVTLLKKNNLPVDPEVLARQRRLKAQKASILQTEQISKPIEESLKEFGLEQIISFKYTSSIRDVDVLEPVFTQEMKAEAEDLEKIVSLMKKNSISVPQDVLNRQLALFRQQKVHDTVRSFENWLVGYMTYLKLDDVEVESIYYSPRTGFLVKFVGLDSTASQSGAEETRKPFMLDKTPTPRIKGKAILSVRLEDGRVIQEETATDTFISAIEHIGISKVKNLGIQMYDRPMIAPKPHPRYISQCKRLSNGEYLMTLNTTERKMQIINSIADYYGLTIRATIIDSRK